MPTEFDFDNMKLDGSSPVSTFLSLDEQICPKLTGVSTASDTDKVVTYIQLLQHAAVTLGVRFPLTPPNSSTTQAAQWEIFQQARREIGKLRLECLLNRQAAGDTVVLDTHWRDKIHSYIAIIRPIVRDAPDLDPGVRESIFTKLNNLAEEVDRERTRVQVFNDVLISLCEGVSAGATALTPAIRLAEKIVGAVARLHGASLPPQLPPPDRLGLPAPDQDQPGRFEDV